jgi:hypothetical protein
MKNAIGLVFLFIMALGAVGWIKNLFALLGSNFDPITGEVMLRVIGVFISPIGAVMGWF